MPGVSGCDGSSVWLAGISVSQISLAEMVTAKIHKGEQTTGVVNFGVPKNQSSVLNLFQLTKPFQL